MLAGPGEPFPLFYPYLLPPSFYLLPPPMNAKLQAAKKRQQKLAANNAGTKRKLIAGDGAMSGGLDPTLYWNARKNGESWEDKGFRDDMARRHPELNLTSTSGRIMVGASGEGGVQRNRFGRVKERLINGQWYDAQTGEPIAPNPNKKPLFG